MTDAPAAPLLFLVVLGGRTARCHVELHDVRFVAGDCIEATIRALRAQWFGQRRGLHIDSYVDVHLVDGFQVVLRPEPQQATAERLYFVNLGAYDPRQLAELHQFGLVVARSPQAAKARAKSRWLVGATEQHKDDLSLLQVLPEVDDCLPLAQVGALHVHLITDPEGRHQPLVPDWFGYRRIDRDDV